MPLTDTKIRQAKPKDKPYKLSDGNNLFLHIQPTGAKYWRYRYNWLGREKMLALGVYPLISLTEARDMRDQARKLKAQLIDPSEFKKEQKRVAVQKDQNTFERIAREWHGVKASSWSPYYSKQVLQRLQADVFPKIGHRPITVITKDDLLKIARNIESRDALEMAHRAIQICGQIFQYAALHDYVDRNPAALLRGALKTPKKENYKHLSANELPEFFEKLERYNGGMQTKLAIKFLMLTFVRTSELCGARWEEIDFDKKLWRIPAARMKMRSTHVVPLSNSALDILAALKRLNGKWEHVFASVQAPRKSMSNNTMLFAVYTMGYKDRTTVHGFRATASTILNESGLFQRDVIERQLAHQERDRVRGAYDHAEHLPARREMMDWWDKYLTEQGLRYDRP